jgi:hypothetical protein
MKRKQERLTIHQQKELAGLLQNIAAVAADH